MSLISVQNLSCSQGAKLLFENVSFGIQPGDKIALVGVNGSGKSTLLSQIARVSQTRNPHIIVKQNLKITLLPQIPAFNPEDTILDHLFRSDNAAAKAVREYQFCLARMETEKSPLLEAQLARAASEMDRLQAWAYEDRVASILKELDIHHLTQKMNTLSGGMIKKVALAQLFFEETDLLILDEPTNHLDIDTIDWLENKLKTLPVTLLMVTHDRYFLDKICTRILEIDQQTLFSYQGNYQTFLEQRAQRYSAMQKEQEDIRTVLRVELEWLKRGPKARSTKQKARKERIKDMMARKTFSEEKVLELGVTGRRLGSKILELEKVTKVFGDRFIIRNFSYTFTKGEKIGILGPNGAGKTTLLNLIAGRLKPDSGDIETGVNTVFGYFDQHSMVFDPDMTVYDHVTQYGQYLTLHDGTRLSAGKLLERFLFPSNSLKTPIGKLSGGERRRLHLVCLLLTNPNFLLFDEPTNDLDVLTLSVLEDFLLNFAGCFIVISHDRYFMDRVVDHLLIFDGKGNISHFWGSYTDYADTLNDMAALTRPRPSTVPERTDIPAPASAAKKKHLSNWEAKELKTLEEEIGRLESEKNRLSELFSFGTAPPGEYERAGKRLKEIDELLDKKLARWEELAELA